MGVLGWRLIREIGLVRFEVLLRVFFPSFPLLHVTNDRSFYYPIIFEFVAEVGRNWRIFILIEDLERRKNHASASTNLAQRIQRVALT